MYTTLLIYSTQKHSQLCAVGTPLVFHPAENIHHLDALWTDQLFCVHVYFKQRNSKKEKNNRNKKRRCCICGKVFSSKQSWWHLGYTQIAESVAQPHSSLSGLRAAN